ncbi:MAG: aspartate/glutamate racemase family protein [Alphaproteobacteria bacterium]|nr:aspartate/glutamate racemase family protein [Alphaproteobacteria bacterium]
MVPRGSLAGGKNLYGYAIGILMIEGRFPRPPGAIGNATTFPFPVMHHVVPGASGVHTVRTLAAMDPDSPEFATAIGPWTDGARHLAAQGCRAITTSCGFAALFQRHLSAAVDVPVFASSLLLTPLIARMLKPGRLVGVVTADGHNLTQAHLAGAGVDAGTIATIGMEGCPEFAATSWDDQEHLDYAQLERETVGVAVRLVEREPRVGAILLECSLLPPYAAAVQAATRLPVFDFTHLVTMVHDACARRPFSGLL